MKILYKQVSGTAGSLSEFGVTNCYCKQLIVDRDNNSVSKNHHHTGYELHIVTKGSQTYEISGTVYQVDAENLLLIFPGITHRLLYSDTNTEKTAITFSLFTHGKNSCYWGKLSPHISDSIAFIAEEAAVKKQTSYSLIENRIFEIIISVLRHSGMPEKPALLLPAGNSTLELAKQYICDNIEYAPTVSEVAQYCYLSAKQLVRIFYHAEGISPSAYIQQERCRRIQQLIAETSLSLRQISEQMNFSSEYYFNVFFKKIAGQPPGEYRKMHGK